MSKERRLGRGLEALLGRSYPDSPNPGGSPRADLSLHVPDGEPLGDAGTAIVDELPADAPPPTGTLAIAIQEIRTNPFQPRRDFDPEEITALADSLRQHGLIQPILVRRAADGYQLIAGERRLRAAIEAGWTEVPVQIREADDRQMAELAIVENLQRKDLNPLEKAASFEQYLQRYGCTQEELASRLNIDRSTIANLIRLLELPAEVQDAIRAGRITQGHARALVASRRRARAGRLLRADSGGRLERSRDGANRPRPDPRRRRRPAGRRRRRRRRQAVASKSRSRSQNLTSLEQELRAALGTKVTIRQSSKGRGKIVIPFASNEEFERLREYLCGGEPEAQARVG